MPVVAYYRGLGINFFMAPQNVQSGDRQELLARLLGDSADPVIDRILQRVQIRSGFRPEDVDDLRSLVHVKLLERLDAAEGEQAPIHSFRDFVAVTTYHAVDDLLRRRYPERTRLKARLRQLIGDDPRFALGSAGRSTVAGLAGWNLASATESPVLPRITAAMCDRTHPAESLLAVFTAAGGPIELDALVTLMAGLWSISTAPHVDAELADTLQADTHDVAAQLATRQSLALLWQEILALPSAQRAALLLNLRDGQGESAISLFIFTGIADLGDLAAALDLSQARLEEMWTGLPFEDARIARLLGVTRQQVINLRKSARARLARRKLRGGF